MTLTTLSLWLSLDPQFLCTYLLKTSIDVFKLARLYIHTLYKRTHSFLRTHKRTHSFLRTHKCTHDFLSTHKRTRDFLSTHKRTHNFLSTLNVFRCIRGQDRLSKML